MRSDHLDVIIIIINTVFLYAIYLAIKPFRGTLHFTWIYRLPKHVLFHCLHEQKNRLKYEQGKLDCHLKFLGKEGISGVWRVLFWKHPLRRLHSEVTWAEPSVRPHKSPTSPNAPWAASVTALSLSTGHMLMSHVIEYVKFSNTGFCWPFWVCLLLRDDMHDPCLHQAFSLHQGRHWVKTLGTVCSLLEMSYRGRVY